MPTTPCRMHSLPWPGCWRGDGNRDGIFSPRVNEFGHIEIVAAKCANHLVGASHFLAVDPDLGTVVDSAKLHPDLLALVGCRNFEFISIPPRHGIGAAGGHLFVGKLTADFIFDAGKSAQIHAVVRVWNELGRSLRGEHCAGDRSLDPIFVDEIGLRDYGAIRMGGAG